LVVEQDDKTTKDIIIINSFFMAYILVYMFQISCQLILYLIILISERNFNLF
jgi:hypothetical protein